MPLKVIYVTRHGFRSNWVVNHTTGEYTAITKSPTGIPSDPALAGKGVEQSQELAAHLVTLSPPIQRFYSSPFFRCVQTIKPTVDLLSTSTSNPETLKIRGENGLGEWYGTARFDHPTPASPELLNSLFTRYDPDYQPAIKPSVNGETISELHDRTAYALHKIVEQADREGVEAIIICTHAATLIAVGRALTGKMPANIEEEDFRPFTCGLSKFVRKNKKGNKEQVVEPWAGPETPIPIVNWKHGKGVAGGWECEVNGDCSFLSGGEERGWRFSGDEAFDTTPGAGESLDAGSGLGVVIEGRKSGSPLSPSRL